MSDDENIDTTINIQGDTEKTEENTEKEEEKQDEIKEDTLFDENILVQESSENLTEEKEVVKEVVEENQDESFEAITEKQYQLFDDGNSLQNDELKAVSEEVVENKIENEVEEKIEEKTENEIVEEPQEEEGTCETKENEIESKEEIVNEEIEEIQEENKEEVKENTVEVSEEIKEDTPEVTEEKEVVEEVYTPKTVVLDFSQEIGKLETALEIKYSSLKLTQFPIKLSNIPEGMTFPDQVVIGNTSIKIGNEVINNCNLRILSNESIRMLEIKHREFKLGLSVSLNDDTIKAYGNVRSYEVSSLIKYSRMLKVFEMFEKIFSGEIISFKVNKLYGDVVVEDRIELMRIKTIQRFFETIDKSGYKFQMDKLPKCENIYYLLELNSAFKEDRVIETWCNFNLKNENLDLHEKDFLIIKRRYQVDKNLTIEEKITLRNPLEKNTIFKEKIVGYRKPCLIELSKVQN